MQFDRVSVLKWPRAQTRAAKGWFAVDVVLVILAAGPILAPLFRASQLPLFVPVGEGITAIGFWICPQPEMAFQLAGYPWAVCSRCYAALFGIIGVRWIYQQRKFWFAWLETWSWPQRLTLTVAAFALWQLDVHAMHHGWWDGGQVTMIFTGILLGIAVGITLCAALRRLIEPALG